MVRSVRKQSRHRIYKEAVKRLRLGHYICNLIETIMRERYPAEWNKIFHPLPCYFPELLKQKPSGKTVHNAWFGDAEDTVNFLTRLKVLKQCIEESK